MMPTGSNLAPQQYRALLHKRFTENKDNVLGFLGTYKDRLEGELQFLSRWAWHAHAPRTAQHLSRNTSPPLSVPPSSYLDFGRPTTRRKSGSGAGREEEEEEDVHVAARAHTPSTPHATQSDRHDKDSASRHRHRTPRPHEKRALPSTPLDPVDTTPLPSQSGGRDRSGSSRSRSSKPKLGHGSSGADASADGAAPASNRPSHSSLTSLREETDSLPLTREVQDLMARQKVHSCAPAPIVLCRHPLLCRLCSSASRPWTRPAISQRRPA